MAKRWSPFRVASLVCASTALLLGCAQILGLKEDVPIEPGAGGSAGSTGSQNSGAGENTGASDNTGGASDNTGGNAASGNGPTGGSETSGAGDNTGGTSNTPECSSPDDCPGTDNDCGKRTCSSGKCGMDLEKQGTALTKQTDGDCKQALCDGKGAIVNETDDTDLPPGGNPCMLDTCKSGVATHDPATTTTACGTTNQFKCDGKGACGGCAKNSDCGLDNLCATYTCTANVCKNNFVASGQGNLANTAGDCKKNVCDGMGSPVAVADNNDLPEDNNPCTKNVCTSGAPTNPYESATKSCGQYSTCNGQGACICSDPASAACARAGAACGNVTNGCGASVACSNTCQSPNTCGGGGVGANACGCTPNAFNCGGSQCSGTISDGCGHTKDCEQDCQYLCPDNCQTKSCLPNGASGYCYCSDCNG